MNQTVANPLCYLEIPAPDLARAEAFYLKIFSWESRRSGDAYSMFQAGTLEGGFDSKKKPSPEGGIVFYIKVADIPATLTAISNAGGTIIKQRTDIGEGWGFFGLFLDPNGNRIGLWERDKASSG